MANQLDPGQILQAILQTSDMSLKVTSVGTASGAANTDRLDPGQVLAKVFDPATGTIRVVNV